MVQEPLHIWTNYWHPYFKLLSFPAHSTVCCQYLCTPIHNSWRDYLPALMQTHKGTRKWFQKRSGHKFDQRQQYNYNLVHEISFPFPTSNHMDKRRLGKYQPPLHPTLKTILFIMHWKNCEKQRKRSWRHTILHV